MAGKFTMSAKGLDRLEVVKRVLERKLSQAKAEELLGLTSRQVRRLCRALERSGPGGLVSRQRGRPSNRRLSPKFQARVTPWFARGIRFIRLQLGMRRCESLLSVEAGFVRDRGMRMPGRSVWLALALALTLAACRLGLEPDAPVLSMWVDEYSAHLSWRPPTRGAFSEFAVVIDGPGGTSRIGTTIGFSFRADITSVRETSEISFRVQALPDADGTRFSNAVTYRRPLLEPGLNCYPRRPGPSGIALTIGSSAFPLVLERRVVDCDGGASAWETLPPPQSTSYFDPDVSAWTDGNKYEYRLFKVAGTERGPASFAATDRAPPLPPGSLAAVPTAEGVRITFVNESRCAVDVTVSTNSTSIAVTAPAAPGEPGEAAAGPVTDSVFAYSAVSRLAGLGLAGVASLPTWTIAPRPEDPNWVTSLAYLTPGRRAVRLPSGAFATASSGSAYAPDGLATDGFIEDLRADDLGRAHATLWKFNLGLAHAEHGGAGWMESVFPNASADSETALDIAPDGTVRVAWREGLDLVIASRRDTGEWHEDRVVALFQSMFLDGFHLASDELSRPHVLQIMDAALRHWFIGASGWEAEIAPVQAREIHAFLSTSDGMRIVYTPAQVGSPIPIEVLERTATEWGVPEEVPGLVRSDYALATTSSDGTRLAVLSHRRTIHVRDALGWTARSVVYGLGCAIGFRPTGKTWVLCNLRDPSLTYEILQPALLHEER